MIDPYLAQRYMDLRVTQRLHEAERRGLASTTPADWRSASSNIMRTTMVKFNWSADLAQKAADSIRTWHNETVEPPTNAAI
jgi:hypothetical protein